LESEIVNRQELTAVAFVMAAVFIAAVMMIIL
jgi:hypothetical protein